MNKNKRATFENLTPELQDSINNIFDGGFLKKSIDEEARQRKNFAETPVDSDFFASLMKPLSQEAEPVQSQSKEMNPVVQDYLTKKIAEKKNSFQREPVTNSAIESVTAKPIQKEPSFMDKYSPEARQKALDASKEGATGMAIAQFLGGFGDVLAGNSPAETAKRFDQYRANQRDQTIGQFDRDKKSAIEDYSTKRSIEQNQITDAQRARDMDPNSEESKMARQLAIKMGMNPEVAKNLTAAKFKETSPALEKMYAVDQARLARQDALSEKRSDKSVKQNATMNEVADRYSNIKDGIKNLKDMVGKYGTQEMLGPQNAQMEQYITSIATDMAKLVDPQSVARESEVASFKKMLFEPGFWQRESTVQGVLDNFSQMVDKRLDNAYKIRGIEKPQMIKDVQSSNSQNSQKKPKTIKQNGHTYTLNETTGEYE